MAIVLLVSGFAVSASGGEPNTGLIDRASALEIETPIVVGAGWSQSSASPPTFLCFGQDACEDGPFTFSVTTPACVSVTDVLLKGDQYRVFDNDVEIGTTPLVPQSTTDTTGDPNLAFLDPTYSSGTFSVGEGFHSIRLELTGPNAFSNARGYIRVDLPIDPVYCPEIADTDEDNDGVFDDVDLCPQTVIPEGAPSLRLGRNRWALVDGDGVFDTNPPPGHDTDRAFTIQQTAGCSCEQIIATLGLGVGHVRFGCSHDAMEAWVALVNP